MSWPCPLADFAFLMTFPIPIASSLQLLAMPLKKKKGFFVTLGFVHAMPPTVPTP